MSQMSGSLRRRQLHTNLDNDGATSKEDRFASSTVLKKMDVFTKIDDDFKVQTSSGAYMSVFAWVLVVVLLISEIGVFLTPRTKEHLVVDTSLGEKLNISLSMTFHRLTCRDIHVDAMDVAGDNQMNIEHAMSKQRLTPEGAPIGRPFLEDPTDYDAKRSLGSNCGSCYGAESDKQKCCNSCAELLLAYQNKGWDGNKIRDKAEQCQPDYRSKLSIQEGEGCRLSGYMEVNKVAGNFHIAFGDSVVKDGRHIHQFVPSEAPGFDVSHTIHHISFGEDYPGRVNPLDGKVRLVIPDIGTGLFQYFVRVIPTTYKGSGDGVIRTNRISVTERFKPLHKNGLSLLSGETHAHSDQTSVLPGVFFVYELSPFTVEVSTTRAPFTHFLTKLCAIAGGVFALCSALDSIVYYSGMFVSKQAGLLTPR